MERRTNPVLAYRNIDAFVAGEIGGLQPYPSYYAYIGPINLMGPDPLPPSDLRELDPADLPSEAALVDIRPRAAYAAGHMPGSLGLEMGDGVGVWAGWLLCFDSPVVLVAHRDQDVEEVVRQFGRIGFDSVLGVVFGVDGWMEARGALSSFETRTVDELVVAIEGGDHPQILDVRGPGEWDDGHVEGSIHRYAPLLRDGLPEELDRSRDVWVVCSSGFRSLAATAFLEAEGIMPIVVTSGGVLDVMLRVGA